MRPNRMEPESAPSWFQSIKVGRMAASYKASCKVGRMAASYSGSKRFSRRFLRTFLGSQTLPFMTM